MASDDLPPYYQPSTEKSASSSSPSSSSYPSDKKQQQPSPEKVDITLYHSALVGTTQTHGSQSQQQLLLPTNLTMLRFWTGDAVDGIECFNASGSATLLGYRTGSPHDFSMSGDRLDCVYVRSGAWIDAIRVTTVQGRQSPWFGGPGGAETKFTGIIVGFVGELGDRWVGKVGVITANEFGDYSGFQRYLEETEAQGLAAAAESSGSGSASASKTKGEEKKKKKEHRFRWDTGRMTGGRGLGVRWNHERQRLEIYQG